MSDRKIVIMPVIILTLLSLILQLPVMASPIKKDSETDLTVSLSNTNTQVQSAKNYDNVKSPSSEDLLFVDKKTFKIIKKAYAQVDFYGEFEKGNPEVYDYYKQQYFKILNLERTFTDRISHHVRYVNKLDAGRQMYINELGEIKLLLNIPSQYTLKDCTFYFFDMDGDGTPELGITDINDKIGHGRFIYFIKYDADLDEFILWYETEATYLHLMGSKKLWQYLGSGGARYTFFSLDQAGQEEYHLQFYSNHFYNTKKKQADTVYMVALPRFTDTSKNIVLTENMKKQAYQKYTGAAFYFRVTKEQWNELTKGFFQTRRIAEENIKKVSFTYDELFGNL